MTKRRRDGILLGAVAVAVVVLLFLWKGSDGDRGASSPGAEQEAAAPAGLDTPEKESAAPGTRQTTDEAARKVDPIENEGLAARPGKGEGADDSSGTKVADTRASPIPTQVVPGSGSALAVGSIEGEVLLSGTPPVMQPLKRGADPVCGKTALNDEAVLVKDGKLANVAVRMVKNAPAGAAKTGPVVIDQKDCMYRPRVQVAQKGQRLSIKNSDGTLHNVHAYYEGTKTWFNQAQPPKAAELVKAVDKDGVLKLKCDVHPWMTGFVVTTDNPYFATTTDGGKFELKGVPAGTYSLESWHERFGTKTREVTVKAGEAAKVTFTYGVDDRGS